MAAVVQLLRGDLFGLIADVGGAPWPRHDDGGADSAELGGNPAAVQGRPGLAPSLAFCARPPDDGIVGRTRPGDVDLPNQIVFAGPGAQRCIPRHHSQKILVDQWFEGSFEER